MVIIVQNIKGYYILCIAYALVSAPRQSYVITNKLLICHLEVNFLHKNPIIGVV